ncbi:DUF4190 domain-containing protein [Streptomyces griseus]|uniref:DUF4190 domain-containing protein n=1 Tax=Streptomyces TaxID=1883 RepID=UPI0020BFE53D|nr:MULTISPECIES: DUF4190 domain-containing protein [unclassified Streptomyces]MCL6292174.1 DUF4190 domain-containing protein [Streptomyces sp. 43Y-GA-1]MDX5572824.1 DUF4190 domain-containing protein [Streptomyces sp. ID01-9D]WSV24323.1 DUF4190 domain-containing protein [Streptomyces fimicarius]
MSDNTEQPGGGAAPRDPWAPPDSGRVELNKPGAQTPPPAAHTPPAVHDQPTVTSMPAAGDGTGPIPQPQPGFGPAPSDVPPPPIGPNGPGHAAPPPAAGHYGYPAPPAQPYGGYPGYGAYGMGPAAWGPAPNNGLGTAAMVIGIISVVGFCMYGVNIILGILALIFGIIGLGRAKRGEATNRGMALAGVILGSVGIVVGAAILGLIIWAATNADSDSEYGDSYDDPFATSLVVEDRR